MKFYFDMDGTLAIYPKEEKWWLIPGIFKELKPQKQVIEAAKKLIAAGEDVYVLSAYAKGSPEVRDHKNEWLDKYLPELKAENRIFVFCGENKAEAIGGISETDVLIDDYNVNLVEWFEAGGTAIKILNGINHKKSWKGVSIKAIGSVDAIVSALTTLEK